MPWEIRQLKQGIYLPQIDWWLDAHKRVPRSFVSHAHFDHLAPHKEILCSPGTARLMRERMRGRRTEHILPFGHTEQLTADSSITLFPAGHIYGSAQCLIDHAEYGKLLYTGDFKLRPGLSAEVCATPRADTLIMETTFGKPQYVFPPTESIIAGIIEFCRTTLAEGRTPILYGYSLGKSQEILSGLAEAKLPVMLHSQTHRMAKVYESLGVSFPPYTEFDAAPEVLAGNVVICPPQWPNSSFLDKIPARRTAMLTGWAIDRSTIYRQKCDAAFPLSDHADYNDLLQFVAFVKPARVYTTHGFTTEFASTLRQRGIEAWALDKENQMDLALG